MTENSFDADAAFDFGAIVREQARLEAESIERACEQVLTTPGDYGVLVTRLPDRLRIEATHDVPFGQIHYRTASA